MVNGFETLLVEVESGVAVVVVNRPEKRNALNSAVRAELSAALDLLALDDAVRIVIITGAGDKAFIAGADITEFAQRTPDEQRSLMSARTVFDAIAEFPKPVIAMINGVAAGGGCELAMACDIRIAARSAKLGQPEVKLGLIPGGGGTQRLPRLVGAGHALRLILSGALIDAVEAQRIGLVELVTEDSDLHAETMELARALAAHSPLTLRLAKRAVRAAERQPLAAGLALERDLFLAAFASEDKGEGVAAFLAKRTAEFKGR